MGTRAQRLMLCGFRNNLNSKFDAEFYISVMMPNAFGVMEQELKFAAFNPLGVGLMTVLTFGIWYLAIIVSALTFVLTSGWELEMWCDDLKSAMDKLKLA